MFVPIDANCGSLDCALHASLRMTSGGEVGMQKGKEQSSFPFCVCPSGEDRAARSGRRRDLELRPADGYVAFERDAGASRYLEGQRVAALVGVDFYFVAVQDFAIEDLHRQRVLDQLLQCALQRTCSVRAVVTLREEHVLGG